MAQTAIFNYDRHYRNFVESIPSNGTRRMYEFHFRRYRKYVKDNLFANNNNNDQKAIEGQIIDYLLSVKKRGLSYAFMNGALCAIMHFYTMNDNHFKSKE